MFLDLAAAQPAAALATRHCKGAWLAVPFESDAGRGTLLYAGPETDAPTVTIPLNAAGWHRVFLGLWSNWTPSTIRVKLSADRAFQAVTRERSDNFTIDERWWRDADLTGQSLQLAQQSSGVAQPACLAYLRLEPLPEPPAGRATKPLIALNDAFSFFHLRRPTTEAEIWEEVQPYLGTDVRKLFWCSGAGPELPTYPSGHYPLMAQGLADYPRVGDRYVAESLAALQRQGIDPLATALRFAHEGGLEFHASVRMAAFQMCAPFDELFTGPAWRERPEWRCRDRDGAEVARLSYAFPEVRQLVLGVFGELLERYDLDGVNPIFNRGAPFLLYEEPLIAAYRAARGRDPRALPERDPDYLQFRAAVMTDFMRDLRRLVDAAGARRGRRLEITAHVLNDLPTNLFFGLDLPSWVRERLVDRLVAYPWRDQPLDVPAFVALAHGTGVEFFPEVMPRTMPPATYRERALALYAAGADGLSFWDTDQRCARLAEWSMLRRLGHADDLAHWGDGAGELFRSVPLRTVGGLRVDRYPPHWAY